MAHLAAAMQILPFHFQRSDHSSMLLVWPIVTNHRAIPMGLDYTESGHSELICQHIVPESEKMKIKKEKLGITLQ